MNIPLENVVMLIGAAQGLLIGLLIMQKHAALYANRFLALMMFAISIVLIHMVLDDLGAYASMSLLFLLLMALTLAVTPLHFLYAKFLTNRSLRFGARDLLHFIPMAAFLASGAVMLSGPAPTANFFFEHRPIDEYPVFLLVFNWAILVQGLSYVGVVLRRIAVHDRQIRNVYSNIETRRLEWLRNITLLAAAAWCSFLVEQTFLSFHVNVSNFIISSILIAVYLFTLGYLGMLKSEVLESSADDASEIVQERGRSSVPTEPASRMTGTAEGAAVGDGAKYERSGLSRALAEAYMTRIIDVMNREKPYRQCELTLSQLAEKAAISPHNCSEVINTQIGKSFYDLVNEYRVRDVKEALADPAKKHLKILAIAFDAGFNSKASFNTIFKQMTHETPSEFRRKALTDDH